MLVARTTFHSTIPNAIWRFTIESDFPEPVHSNRHTAILPVHSGSATVAIIGEPVLV